MHPALKGRRDAGFQGTGLSLALFLAAGLVLAAGPSRAQCPDREHSIEVSSLADSGPGTLRAALTEANGTGGDAMVSFSVSGVVSPTSELPVLTAASVTVDGSAAPAPGVVVDGVGAISNGLLVEGADACVRGLTFRNFIQDGVRIRGAAAQGGWVEEVIALDNGDDGLQVSEGASATLIANRSRGNGNKGLLVFAGAWAMAENNQLNENGDGVTVSNGSTVVLFNNVVTDNDDIGIGLTSGSQGEIRGNILVGNGVVGPNSEGIRLTKAAQAEIASNEIRGNGDKGVVVMGKSHAEITGNEIAENQGGGIVVAYSGDVVVEDNEIVTNGEDGVRLVFGAQADLGGGGRSDGENLIQLNDNYEVKNETSNAVSATGNTWEAMTAAELDEIEIYDDDEEEGAGKVDFVPRLGEADWDGDDVPDREDACPHLTGIAPQPISLSGAQMVKIADGGGRGRVRFKGAFHQTSVTHDPDGGDGFFLTIRQEDGNEVASLILPGGSPWVKSRGRNQWDYRVNGWQRVRSYLREVGAPGNGRYRMSVDYKNVVVDRFPPDGLLQYSVEFVATDTCYHVTADRCLSMFVPALIYLCR